MNIITAIIIIIVVVAVVVRISLIDLPPNAMHLYSNVWFYFHSLGADDVFNDCLFVRFVRFILALNCCKLIVCTRRRRERRKRREAMEGKHFSAVHNWSRTARLW